MIIIKIIIQYFIQIRHSDDFPSTGIPASGYNYLIIKCKHLPIMRRPPYMLVSCIRFSRCLLHSKSYTLIHIQRHISDAIYE